MVERFCINCAHPSTHLLILAPERVVELLSIVATSCIIQYCVTSTSSETSCVVVQVTTQPLIQQTEAKYRQPGSQRDKRYNHRLVDQEPPDKTVYALYDATLARVRAS